MTEATTETNTEAIRVRGVHRRFQLGDQTVHALNDINLDITQGLSLIHI